MVIFSTTPLIRRRCGSWTSRAGRWKGVTLGFYQKEYRSEGYVVDAEAEFVVPTDDSGTATLPNRGITGFVTATGHQLRPNPFGEINVNRAERHLHRRDDGRLHEL